jgi:hypothetical protein
VEIEKIAGAGEELARNRDRGQKNGIFQPNPLYTTRIKNHAKTY